MPDPSDHVEAIRRLNVIASWCDAQDPEVFLWLASPEQLQSATEVLLNHLTEFRTTLDLGDIPEGHAQEGLCDCLEDLWAHYYSSEWIVDRFQSALDGLHLQPVACGETFASTATQLIWLLADHVIKRVDRYRLVFRTDEKRYVTVRKVSEDNSEGEDILVEDSTRFDPETLGDNWEGLRDFAEELFRQSDMDRLRVAVQQECRQLRLRKSRVAKEERSMYCSPRRSITLSEIGLDALLREVELEPPTNNAEDRRIKPEPRPKYQFHLSGANFKVRFEGEEGDIPSVLLGAKILYRLLQSPGKSFSAFELRNAPDPGVTTASTGSYLGWEPGMPAIDPDEMSLGPEGGMTLVGSPNLASDREDARLNEENLKRDADRLGEEIERAKSADDLDAYNQLNEQLEGVAAAMQRLRGYQGRLRVTDPGLERDRVSVTNAVKAVIKNCREKYRMPKFAAHIDDWVDTGSNVVYSPPDPIPEWHF